MKRSVLSRGSVLPLVLMLLVSCSGTGQYSSDSGGGGGSTTISGKVSLSGTASKPLMTAAKMSAKMSALKTRDKTRSLAAGTKMGKLLSMAGIQHAGELAFATVELYNADRPEWLYPVAVSLTDSVGDYTLDALTNAANNTPPGGTAPYTDGDDIPAGKFTVIASKFDTNTGKLYVAVQAIVKAFDGTIAGNDLVAQDSDAIPSVSSMIGLPKNADGTFGSAATNFSQRGAVQITFNMAMSRLSLMESIVLLNGGTPVQGIWKVSADLLSVTFYPASELTAGNVYTVRVGGGTALKTAKNVYGRKLAATVIGAFTAVAYDPTAPEAVKDTPQPGSSSNVSITTPIRFASTEPLDLNTLYVTSNQNIGDKPAILYVGRLRNDYWPYVYQIVPSTSLNVATTYRITVTGGKGLDGDVMTDLQFNFTTETVSVGVTDATSAAVKDVFGKWVNALNSRNSALLTSYMTGDFYWVTDPANSSSDDLNRDGRLSLKEFTQMLNSWFGMLDLCSTVVTGDIVDDPTDPDDGISVTGSTAHIAFNLTLNTTSTAPACSEGGPPSVMYAELMNINGAWIMTRGSEIKPGSTPAYPAYLPGLSPITLAAPANGKQFAEPTATAPLLPTFQWEAQAGITTYAVILIDARSQWQERGWVALMDGFSAAPGTTMSMRFSSLPGDFGNTIVFGEDGLNEVGFWKKITTLKAGGSYYWSVIGFNTITLDDLRLNRDPADPTVPLDAGKYISASSEANSFSVAGNWREMKMTVSNFNNSITYPYSIWYQGYDVGSESIVNLEFETPNVSATSATVRVEGYTWQEFTNVPIANGKFSLPSVTLSNKKTRIQVSDGMEPDLDREFNILTTGGVLPKIRITSVTAKDCSGAPVTLVGPDFWDKYTGIDVCKVSVSGTIDTGVVPPGTLWLFLFNEDDNGRWQESQTIAGTFSFVDIPVFKGFNWINLNSDNGAGGPQHRNGFGIETATGSIYTPPILVTGITGATPITGNLYESYWDAVAATSATITISLLDPDATTAGYNQYSDPNWMFVGNGSLTANTINPLPITLYSGWNIVDIWDSQNNFYRVYILTIGGTVNTPPHVITSVSDSGGTLTGPPYNTGDCAINITGHTANGANGPVQLNLNSYNSSTGQSIYESYKVNADGAGDYILTGVNVYYGSNYIDIWDAQWHWQGFKVNNNNTLCVATVFDVTGITPGTPNVYGEYDAGSASTVTIGGTAKTGRTITFYVNGQYYKVLETTAGAVVPNTFSLSVPIYNGYNYISITDGYNWIDKTVFTSGGATYTPSIYNVSLNTGTKTDGGGAADNWASWNVGMASSITISGSADVNGIGNYYVSGSYTMSGNFTIVGGSFSVPVNLGMGWNYISLYDKVGNGYYLNVYTDGGAAPVQVVTITNPAHNAQISLTGQAAVTGTVNEGAVPTPNVRAYVYDFKTYTETWYSSVPSEQVGGGGTSLPISYSSGNFSFNAQVIGGNMTYIEVTATSPTGGSHGHSIYVNNELGYGSNIWKPGVQLTKSGAIARAHMTEAIKKRR